MNTFVLEVTFLVESSRLLPPGPLQSSVKNTPGARTYCRTSIAAPTELSRGTKVDAKILAGFSESSGYLGVPVAFLPSFFQRIAKAARQCEVLWAIK